MRIHAILSLSLSWVGLLLAGLLVAVPATALEPEAELEKTLEAIRDVERSLEERREAVADLEDRIAASARGAGEQRERLDELKRRREAQEEVIAEHEARVARREERLHEQRHDAARLVHDQWLQARHGQRERPTEGGQRHHPVYAAAIQQARERTLAGLHERIEELQAARAGLTEERERLARRETETREAMAELERQEAARRAALEELEAAMEDEALELERLERNAETLDRVITEIEEQRRATSREKESGEEAAPRSRAVNPDVPFADLEGELPRPVDAPVIRDFGSERRGSLRSQWNGVVLEAPSGAPVRAVHQGRVVYADWMQGYGFLVILDHGDGYLTLYGNLEDILAGPGESADAGEPVGRAGEGSPAIAPGLYFEVRREGRTLNPQAWWPSQ
ncbi:murein hydrolase activator EnvC [Thioalkalivibrio sp. AKL17]|uniref:murein hydrolase activator EnvC family protein n=1 Tax=Thioalkalivibrio sp. AKL17 TaxID=1158160 RepID=UPI000478035F|nr:peptidoglycan DD-metalloendopeptidase family protein [Thioalkalivibrio sp. AKL17]